MQLGADRIPRWVRYRAHRLSCPVRRCRCHDSCRGSRLRAQLEGWYRRQARAQGYSGARCGSVTFVQRFGSSINLNPHFHVLMLDGVYVPAADGEEPVFAAAPPLADEDVHEIVETAAQRHRALAATSRPAGRLLGRRAQRVR
ncbi:MAG TPA: hypothetical protein EYM39_09785, partial [Candidatus Latescibacteria bacterium]|nr:hypothetical protein [Candidatus Latescibacterota bacterium]